MAFKIRAELHYEVQRCSTVLPSMHALAMPNQRLEQDAFEVTPGVTWEELRMSQGRNRYIGLDTGAAETLDVAYSVMAETRQTMVSHDTIRDIPISEIDTSAISYLVPSRYCQSDRLGRLAIKILGAIEQLYQQAVAISDWIFENIDCLSGTNDAETSAFDTVTLTGISDSCESDDFTPLSAGDLAGHAIVIAP